MAYIKRELGIIVGYARLEQDGMTEYMADDDAELLAFMDPPALTNGEIYDIVMLNEKVLKAVILALNDGTFVPGSNYTNAQLKTGIKNRM